MLIRSPYSIPIPTVDLLTYAFERQRNGTNEPMYINADDPSQRVTKAELEALVKKLGKGLRERARINKGDVVLTCATNSIQYPLAFFGTICAGAVFTGANPAYTLPELSHHLRLSEAKLVFTDAGRLPLVRRAAQEVGLSADSVYLLEGKGEAPSIDDLLKHGELQWERLDRLEDLTQRTAVLNFSSGTTGMPKACMVSHRNLVANAEQNRYLDDMSRDRLQDPTYALKEIHVAYLPLYHAMGQMLYCTLNLRRECPSYIMPQFTLPLLLQAIHRYKVTYLALVPPIAVLLIKSPLVTQYDLSSVKFLLCAAAPLGKETALQLEKLFHANNASVKQAWGMSEATCSTTLFAPDEHDPEYVGVGYLCANMEAKIITDDGREVGYGEKGEAVLRGPNIFQGYYKNPEATRESWTEDGWLKTGDYVVVQPNGMFAVVDRKKELIKVKGFQVAPSELESHLLDCPLVSDCAVTRVMRNGEEHPQAHIVPAGKHVSAAAIHAFMEPRITAHKRLTGGIVFTDAIPKSASGKILRRLLKDQDGEGAAPRAKL